MSLELEKEKEENSLFYNSHTQTKKIAGIPTSRVLNTEFLLSLGDIYKCNICFNIMNKPADCDNCGHSYCFECITNFKCPFNCESAKTKPSSLAIKVLLNQIIFKCENEGCFEKLTYNNILLHDQDCEYKPTKCPSPNCGLTISNKNLEKHIKEECRHIYKKCKYCENEFYRYELKEHEENCELVYNTLSNIPQDGKKSNLIGNKYIEALNFNIAKIIKENETKYKNLEEDNNNKNNNGALNMESLIEVMKEEIKTIINSINNNKKDSNIFNEENLNSIKTNVIEILQKNLNDVLLIKIKKMLDQSTEYIKDYFENVNGKNGFDSMPNQFSTTEASNIHNNITKDEEDNNINEEMVGLIVNAMKLSQDNICDCIKEYSEKISEDMKLIKDVKAKKVNEKENEEIKEDVNKTNFELLNTHLETIKTKIVEFINNSNNKNIEDIKEKLSDSMNSNQEGEVNKIDAEKLTSYFVKNVIEIVEDNKENFIDLLNFEIKKLNDIIIPSFDKFYEEVENLKTEINSVNKKTKEINKIISEEFEDLSNKIDDNSSKIDQVSLHITNGKCICHKLENFEKIIDKFIDNKIIVNPIPELKDDLPLQLEALNLATHLSVSPPALSESFIELKLKDLESRLIISFDIRLKEMYNLKWCNECEKVDYFFGFIKCQICLKETCKQCVLLCKTCHHLFCRKCVECSKCRDFSCLNCRLSCSTCSVSKGDKFCSSCIKECIHCKKPTCQECIKQCISCKNMSCNDCSKFCRICNKSSCLKCETSKNFKKCYSCQNISCIECIVTCKICEMEICRTCLLLCKRCKKIMCKKCGVDCAMCCDSYCGNCAKEFTQNKCGKCKNTFCTVCVKNFRKCKVCKENACKDCQSQCKKCKNYFCNNCSLNCDNCNDFTCLSCVYKCVCDLLIFCEKCLLDVNPIGPHNCVLWMNDSTDFNGIKSRSKLALPKNFEAKLYLEKFESDNLLVGITDNNTFDEDSISFVDNIWAFKAKTGQKYSTKKSLEPYYKKESREKDFIIIAVKNDNLYFRINFDENPPAFVLPTNREFFLYVENDSQNRMANVRVKFIYIRKI